MKDIFWCVERPCAVRVTLLLNQVKGPPRFYSPPLFVSISGRDTCRSEDDQTWNQSAACILNLSR